ncbi:MAG: hypothetical protein ACYTFI_19205 [Planctomycetota bacterium]
MYRAFSVLAALSCLVGGFHIVVCCVALATAGARPWEPFLQGAVWVGAGLVLWLLREIGMRTERIEEMLTITQMKEERARLERELAQREKEAEKAGRSEDK